jgi:hypothetical protein
MNTEQKQPPGSRWPWHGWLGLALVALFWALNWCLTGLRTQWGFFPLWLGYALTVDALVYYRRGHSMLTRNVLGYVAMFVVSAPAWWLFELLNVRTQNWFYDGREFFTDLQYALLATLSFSTVMPAVFGTAEFICTFQWLRNLRSGPRVQPSSKMLLCLFASGWLMLALMLKWPTVFFPLLWGSVFLILEPVNVWLGNRSLLDFTRSGDWRPVIALSIGCLICGFFWEMWNYYSYPKWIYVVPFVDFWHIFEMPLLGYLGYLVFPWELYALYHLVARRGRTATVQHRTLNLEP